MSLGHDFLPSLSYKSPSSAFITPPPLQHLEDVHELVEAEHLDGQTQHLTEVLEVRWQLSHGLLGNCLPGDLCFVPMGVIVYT